MHSSAVKHVFASLNLMRSALKKQLIGAFTPVLVPKIVFFSTLKIAVWPTLKVLCNLILLIQDTHTLIIMY
jgi:hypothetical protein